MAGGFITKAFILVLLLYWLDFPETFLIYLLHVNFIRKRTSKAETKVITNPFYGYGFLKGVLRGEQKLQANW